MKTLLMILLVFTGFAASAKTEGNDRDTSTLVVGLPTNSVEGYGKFYAFREKGDTLLVFSADNRIKPGMYLITACDKNEYYHKKVWVVDPRFEMILDTKKQVPFLAILVGITNDQSYSKVKVVLDSTNPEYLVATDPDMRMNPGTYLIVGASRQDLFHRKMVIAH